MPKRSGRPPTDAAREAADPRPRGPARALRAGTRAIDPAVAGALALAWVPLALGAGHGFYLDDLSWLEWAAGVRSPLDAIAHWRPGEYRPLAQLLFLGEYLAFGLAPVAFNLVSLVLHAVAVLLVARLSRACGLSPRQAGLAAALFAAGFGHYNKSVTWACAQGGELATIFLLLGATPLLRSQRNNAPSSNKSPGFVGPVGAFALAVLAHEQTLPALVGLVVWAWLRHHRSRALISALCALLVAAYFLGTMSIHGQHQVSGRIGEGVLGRVLIYPAAFILPVQAPAAIARLLGSASLGASERMLSVLTGIVGVVVIAGAVLVVRRAGRAARDAAMLGVLLFLVALVLPRPGGWVEARHFYPVAAFLVPALLQSYRGPIAPGRRLFRAAVGVLLAAWGVGILAGSIYFQFHARELARDPGTVARFELLKRAVER